MNKLIKIEDVSTKYDITAHILRYYEDMGLIGTVKFRISENNKDNFVLRVLIFEKMNILMKTALKSPAAMFFCNFL